MRNIIGGTLLFAALLTAPGLSCLAQTGSIPRDTEAKENVKELGSLSGTGTVKTFDNRYEGVKGSPFTFEHWYPGVVLFKDGSSVPVKELNYNCYDNEIAYRDPDGGEIFLINKYKVQSFSIAQEGKKLLFEPVQIKEGAAAVFAQIIYNESSTAYRVYRKEFLSANYEGAYSADRRSDEFVDKADTYFLKKGESQVYKMKKSKKYFISCFPENEDEISYFIKANKLNMKEEDSLIEVLRYYDSL